MCFVRKNDRTILRDKIHYVFPKKRNILCWTTKLNSGPLSNQNRLLPKEKPLKNNENQLLNKYENGIFFFFEQENGDFYLSHSLL